MFKCLGCSEFVFDEDSKTHECAPIYLVWNAERHGDDDDGFRVRARTHADAAGEWAQYDDHNSADYSIVGGETVDVRVRLESNPADEKWFSVRGESVPHYYAEVIPRPSAEASR